VRVHQVLSGAGPYDAVTTQAFAFRALFSAWGWDGRDVAAEIDPRVGGRIAPLRSLDAAPGDVLLIHYSAYAPKLRAVLELPNRKLLLSHNITPARWFWDHDPQAAVVCALGRKQLPQFAAAADVVAGVSLYNAREMGSETVIPILFDPRELGATRDTRSPGGSQGAGGDAPEPPSGPPTILFVGRLAPHKRQDAIMRAFELYRRRHAPDARLVLVGAPVNWGYDAAMRELAEELSPGAITIESGLTREQLAERYRSAHAFLCLSEHEGFCIPLLEAFHFGVPVIARPVGGVPEVAGDAALLLGDGDGESVVAELLALATADAELRATLNARAAARVAAYAPEPTARALRAAVQSLAR
jgi:glycosyltransferase involved in cell wall biosynthesis